MQGRRARSALSTRAGHGARRAETARHGASAMLAVVLLACALALGVLVWSLRGRAAPDPSATEAPGSGARAPIAATPPLQAGQAGGEHAGARSVESRPGAPSPTLSKQDFDGRGVIRGEVVVPSGVAFPQRWTLVIEPSPFLQGRERAVRRTVEFEQGEREFRVDDLPLAGYAVRAHAARLNHLGASVLLVRGSADQFVTLAFRPAGLLDGIVRTSSGGPADGLDVTLESATGGERRMVSTDAAGKFVFQDVVDDEYRVIFGDLNAPLLPPETVSFQAPSLRVPDRELPPTARLNMRTMTVDGRPRPDTHVTGYGKPRGAFDLRSGPDARAVARYLLPGEYRIDALSPEGEKADVALVLDAGLDATLELRLQP